MLEGVTPAMVFWHGNGTVNLQVVAATATYGTPMVGMAGVDSVRLLTVKRHPWWLSSRASAMDG